MYTGEQFDPNAGFYYLRARYMNPSNGRFTQQDAFDGIDGDPQSIHKYLYANAGPINGTDPSGNLTLGQIAVSSAIGATMSSIATVMGNHALGRPTTVGDIVSASVLGAALGPLAAANATFAVGVGAISAVSSSFLLSKVFANPDSTFFQKTEAVALVAASVFGLRVGINYYRSGGASTEVPNYPLKVSAPEGVVLESPQPGLRGDKIGRIPEHMKKMLDGRGVDDIGGWKFGNRYIIGEGNHRMAAALELYKQTGNPEYVLALLRNGHWTQVAPPNRTFRITQ
ncbi:RHS repeat-associated core domain-containing protein [Tahibacter sp. UC22_41]|uniref:RHS repeat-associated core domain-containing protein n=1 Tax=Tahibacter sp. UC22_41 TaxID=3350178 RepID=UPI0036DC8C69